MKRKWLVVLCAAVLVVVTVLIWNGTAERRYFRQVQTQQWSVEWVAKSDADLRIDLLDWPGETLKITDPEMQKAVFKAIAELRFEGTVQPHHAFRTGEENYQIRLWGTDVGAVSITLIGSEPEPYDRRPRYALSYDNDTDIILGGAGPLLEVVRTAFASATLAK